MGTQWGPGPPQQLLPTFGPCLLWPNGYPSQQLLSSCFYWLDALPATQPTVSSTEGKFNSLVVHLLWLMTVTSEATQHSMKNTFLKPRLQDATGCQTGLTAGCIVYTNIQQPAVSYIQPVSCTWKTLLTEVQNNSFLAWSSSMLMEMLVDVLLLRDYVCLRA